jgi:hypothetical protein
VAGDDPRDIARAQRTGLPGAGQREQQMVGRSGRATLDPDDDRLQRILVERHGAGAAALGVPDGHPPARGTLDGLAQARVRGASALVDVADEQVGRLGTPQPGGAEQVQQRQVALALARAAVGHPQKPRELVVGQGARFAARDARRADRADGRVGVQRPRELA